MKKITSILAIIGVLAIASPALAATTSINFENPPYTLGDIDGQDGWSSTGPYDHAVSTSFSTPTFSAQSLRISNAVTSGSFGDQTFSKSLADDAGEPTAQPSSYSGGTRQSHFEAQFSLASVMPTAQQSGLIMSVSPDRGDGARMSYLRFEDQATGVHVFFDDYQDALPRGTLASPANGCSIEDDFIETDIATLNRAVPHTIKFAIDFVAGPANDIVKIYIDGALAHTGTTWEDYYRWCTESGGGVVNGTTADVSRAVDSLLFRTGGTAVIANSGKGFLIDNLSLLSGVALTSPTNDQQCKKDGWMTFNNPTFKSQGQCKKFVKELNEHKEHKDDKDHNEE